MAANVIVYFALLAAMCLYAVARGGEPERLAAIGWALASIATLALPFDPDRTFQSVDLAGAAIDVVVLLWFVMIAAVANRFWPIWVAALHLLGLAVHGVKAYQPDLLPSIYAAAVGKIAYPILAIIAVGVFRHRGRLKQFGPYRDWFVPGQAA